MKLQRRQSQEPSTSHNRLKAGDLLQYGQEPAPVDHLPRIRPDFIKNRVDEIQRSVSAEVENLNEDTAEDLLFKVDDLTRLTTVFPEMGLALSADQLEVARKKIEPFLIKLNGTLDEAKSSQARSRLHNRLSSFLMDLSVYKSCFGDKGSTDLLSDEMLNHFLERPNMIHCLDLMRLRPDQRSRIETQALVLAREIENQYKHRAKHSAGDPQFFESFINKLARFILIFPDRRHDFPMDKSDWKKMEQIVAQADGIHYTWLLLMVAVLNAEDAGIDEQGIIRLSRRKAVVGQPAKLPDRLHT